MDKIEGFLEVGNNDSGEVVINYTKFTVDENGAGHIVFSPNQARVLAKILNGRADLAEREDRKRLAGKKNRGAK